MEWRNSYLDMIFVPMGLLLPILYHAWLCHKVRCHPHRTDIGINAAGRLAWVMAMMKDNGKKDILVVQTVRNSIMGSTVMATASIFLSSGLAAIIGSTYSANGPIIRSVYGAHGSLAEILKFVTILLAFLFAFLFYSLSINSMNQVIFLINLPNLSGDDGVDGPQATATRDYVCGLLEKGFFLQTVGSRFFYAGIPLVLWVFGPVLLFSCSVVMVCVLYNIDVVVDRGEGKGGGIGRMVMFDASV